MAIAYDASATATVVDTSLTYSHTCTGSNRGLVVFLNNNTGSATITGVTYNGVAMTQLHAFQNSDANTYLYSFYLLNPASGANNIVVSANTSTNMNAISMSFTGVAQSGQPDASGTVTAAVAPGAGQTKAITTVAANSWMMAFCHGAGDPPNASTGTTSRQLGGNARAGTYSSNPVVTPGSTSMSFTNSGAGTISLSTMALSFSPLTSTNYPLAAAQGSFTLTGQSALLKKGYTLIGIYGAFTLTGSIAQLLINRARTIWTNASKNATSFSNQTKNTTSFSNESKNTSIWTNQDKTLQ